MSYKYLFFFSLFEIRNYYLLLKIAAILAFELTASNSNPKFSSNIFFSLNCELIQTLKRQCNIVIANRFIFIPKPPCSTLDLCGQGFERCIHLFPANAPTNRGGGRWRCHRAGSISRAALSNEYYKRHVDSYAVSRPIYGSNALLSQFRPFVYDPALRRSNAITRTSKQFEAEFTI